MDSESVWSHMAPRACTTSVAENVRTHADGRRISLPLRVAHETENAASRPNTPGGQGSRRRVRAGSMSQTLAVRRTWNRAYRPRSPSNTPQSLGMWLPANGGGMSCDYVTNPGVLAISADWSAASTTVTGSTIQRTAATDGNSAADWIVAAQTLGASNLTPGKRG